MTSAIRFIPPFYTLNIVLLLYLNDLARNQRLDVQQQIFRHVLIGAEYQQIDMLRPDQIDDLIHEIGIDHVTRQHDFVLTGVIDQVLQGFMKPDGLLVFRRGGRYLLKNIDLRADPIRQRQGIMDAFEGIGGWSDGDQYFSGMHGLGPHGL
jgi:hypothetical protein